MKAVYYFLLLALIVLSCGSDTFENVETEDPIAEKEFFMPVDSAWVDSVMGSLSLEEKIAQTIFIRAYSNRDAEYDKSLTEIVKKYKVGGLTFFQGGPEKQIQMTQNLQNISTVPLLVSIDAEWGLGMRLDSTVSFPKQMTLGAIRNDSLIYLMGREIGYQCSRLGIHINFAPVVDVNNNPANPVINYRSFGENPHEVGKKALSYIHGMQDLGVMATVKHFPGHGDTDKDSHYTLPIIKHSRKTIDSLDLLPFEHCFDRGVASVMVAHLFVPALDSTPNRPTTLSPYVVTELLKNELKYDGLVITDGLEMRGIADHYPPGKIEIQAIKSGIDVLLLPSELETAIQSLKTSVESGDIPLEHMEEKCRRVLEWKCRLGLHITPQLKMDSVMEDINTIRSEVLKKQLFEAAVTLAKNNDLMPLKKLDTLKIASVSVGRSSQNNFSAMLNKYSSVDAYSLPMAASSAQINNMLEKLDDYNLVIVGLFSRSNSPQKNYGLSSPAVSFADRLAARNNTVLALFGNAYGLASFGKAEDYKAIIAAYENKPYAHQAVAKAIFGGIKVNGKLPVTASDYFVAGQGIQTERIRLNFALPEEMGYNTKYLEKIDSIILASIADGVMPGCQVLFAREGQVFYNKSFGYHTYDKKIRVQTDDIYDLASLTKILATTPSMMKLLAGNAYVLDDKLGKHLPILDSSNKEDLIIRQIMAHQARLKSWIPFYKHTLDTNGMPDSKWFSSKKTREYCVQVHENLFMRPEYQDTILRDIIESELLSRKRYKYSDLGFYLLKEMIELKTGEKFDSYTNKTFFGPLGMNTMQFNPSGVYPLNKIVPTENDQIFRKNLVHAYVHDQGAAMMGGVEGHAGLFANALDVAKILQMYLDYGYYGGEQYLDSAIINEFTSYQYPGVGNRRGIGFDKPYALKSKKQTAADASLKSYGHSGFTGTYCWVDPEYDLVYVFLSNRVHPDAENWKIVKTNLRTSLHQLVYEMIKEGEKNPLH